VAQAFGDGRFAPGHVAAVAATGALATAGLLGDLEHALGRICSPVEDQVLGALPERRIDGLVDRERARVDDAHVHAGADCVVKEDGVDRLANDVVAAEGEGNVRHAAADEPRRAARASAS